MIASSVFDHSAIAEGRPYFLDPSGLEKGQWEKNPLLALSASANGCVANRMA